MIRIALCDDDHKMLDDITGYISSYGEKVGNQGLEVFRFDSAKSLENALDDGKSFDIYILDVYIGDEMGTGLAKSIRKRGIINPIVFVTSSLEHAPMGYEVGTLRYILKPVDKDKLFEAMDAALAAAERLGERLIKLKTENGVESINVNHIMYSEAHDHYQYVMLEDGKVAKVRMTVSELYTVLMNHDGFVRVGSAYVVNLRNIKNVTTGEVHLYNDVFIPIPRGKHNELKKAFWSFQCEGQED